MHTQYLSSKLEGSVYNCSDVTGLKQLSKKLRHYHFITSLKKIIEEKYFDDRLDTEGYCETWTEDSIDHEMKATIIHNLSKYNEVVNDSTITSCIEKMSATLTES